MEICQTFDDLKCQLYFLVLGIKAVKLWSRLKEQNHETGFLICKNKTKTGLSVDCQVQQAIKLYKPIWKFKEYVSDQFQDNPFVEANNLPV